MQPKKKKIVLITGCSSGFGMLTAVHLASHGHEVYATMRNLDKRDRLLEHAREQKADLRLMRLDVTQKRSIQEVIAAIKKDYGRLDVLINNAGYGLGGFFGDINDREYRGQMETNFFGVLNVTRTALPLLHKSKDARIINVSSVAGLTATPGMGAYNASKWALEAFGESLRFELLPFGIKVLMVEPGPYPTEVLGDNARFAHHADSKKSRYYPYTMRLYRMYQKRNRNVKSNPMAVARLMKKLVERRNPRFRNIIGPTARLRSRLRRFLPWRPYQWIIKSIIYGRSNSKV